MQGNMEYAFYLISCNTPFSLSSSSFPAHLQSPVWPELEKINDGAAYVYNDLARLGVINWLCLNEWWHSCLSSLLDTPCSKWKRGNITNDALPLFRVSCVLNAAESSLNINTWVGVTWIEHLFSFLKSAAHSESSDYTKWVLFFFFLLKFVL